jgi:glycosyltransferase involved in cell wall biosynthesis
VNNISQLNDYYISIIIPSFNEEKFVAKCLESIKNLNTPIELYEVIVVDNGSTDRTVEIINSFKTDLKIKIIINNHVNIAGLRNLGAKHSKGNILAFVDSDCVVSKEWLNKALPYFNHAKNAAVGSRHEQLSNTWVARAWSNMHSKKKVTGEADWLPSGNMIVRKKYFDNVNGFDDGLETTEDYDLCQRLRGTGYIIYSDPEVASLHLDPPQSLAEFFKKELWHGKETIKMLLKKDINIFKYPAFLYALFYLMIIIGLVIASILYATSQHYKPFIILTTISLTVPFVLAFNTLYSQKKLLEVPSLTLLYVVYGFARALCLLNINNYLGNDTK